MLAGDVAESVRRGGTLMLSGILNPEAAAVIAAYAAARLHRRPAPADRRMDDADAAQAALSIPMPVRGELPRHRNPLKQAPMFQTFDSQSERGAATERVKELRAPDGRRPSSTPSSSRAPTSTRASTCRRRPSGSTG